MTVRILIVGAKGQLGRDLVERFKARHTVKAVDVDDVDITERKAMEDLGHRVVPELVINAAAYTNVDGAEDDNESAYLVNEVGARNVAEIAAEHKAPVVYYSTDYVFGGTKIEPYEVDDPMAPIGVYAKSKAAGEAATRMSNPKHFVIRTAWLYGPGGNNFVEKIISAAQSRPSLKVVDDEVGSPTHTYDLAEATEALVSMKTFGVYHATNQGACSRYDFAREILRLAKLDTPIEPCKSTEFPTKAERPLFSVLSMRHLEDVTGYTMRTWEDALAHYFQRR